MHESVIASVSMLVQTAPMPHLILEYSDNIAPNVRATDLLKRAHLALQATGIFNTADLKSRAYTAENYLTGDSGTSGSFVHAWFYLLEGRTEAQKTILSDTLFALLQENASFANQISVDICDMNKACYRKLAR